MWEIVEIKAGEVRIVEAKGREEETGTRKEIKRERGKEEKEKPKERKRNRSTKNSRRVGDLG